jgi:hypothetical protein
MEKMEKGSGVFVSSGAFSISGTPPSLTIFPPSKSAVKIRSPSP